MVKREVGSTRAVFGKFFLERQSTRSKRRRGGISDCVVRSTREKCPTQAAIERLI